MGGGAPKYAQKRKKILNRIRKKWIIELCRVLVFKSYVVELAERGGDKTRMEQMQ